MPNVLKIPLSASTHGRGITVAATAIGSGTTIHTALATTTDGEGDTVSLEAYNTHATDFQDLVVGWGGTTDPGDLKEYKIPVGGWVRIEGFLRNGLVIAAATTDASSVVIWGEVLRAE